MMRQKLSEEQVLSLKQKSVLSGITYTEKEQKDVQHIEKPSCKQGQLQHRYFRELRQGTGKVYATDARL